MHWNVDEALRYLGAANADDALRARVAKAGEDLLAQSPPRWVWKAFALERTDFESSTARKMLSGCHSVCVLVCTLGARSDALLRAAQARGMDCAVILDACMSALAEAGCDEAEKEIAARFPGMYLTDRFSPGYGDLPLGIQPVLLRETDAQKRLGVAVTESHLLLPQKTVTALIGLSSDPQPARVRGCQYCTLRSTCTYRKEGGCHLRP